MKRITIRTIEVMLAVFVLLLAGCSNQKRPRRLLPIRR